jgi:hypothetical protein
MRTRHLGHQQPDNNTTELVQNACQLLVGCLSFPRVAGWLVQSEKTYISLRMQDMLLCCADLLCFLYVLSVQLQPLLSSI